MNTFIVSVLIKVLSNDAVQAKIKELLGSLITERILPLIPIAVAAASKAAVEQIIEKVPSLEGVVDVVEVADNARDTLNDLIPDIDVGIPQIDQLLDFWRPKG